MFTLCAVWMGKIFNFFQLKIFSSLAFSVAAGKFSLNFLSCTFLITDLIHHESVNGNFSLVDFSEAALTTYSWIKENFNSGKESRKRSTHNFIRFSDFLFHFHFRGLIIGFCLIRSVSTVCILSKQCFSHFASQLLSIKGSLMSRIHIYRHTYCARSSTS